MKEIFTLNNNNDNYYLFPSKDNYILKYIKDKKEHSKEIEIKDVINEMDNIEKETGKQFKIITLWI